MARAKRRHSSEDEADFENEAEEGMRDSTERAERQVRQMQRRAMDVFDVINGPMARLMDQNWSMFQKAMQAMQAESLKFMNRRLEHTGHALESSRECDNFSGLVALQQEWMVEFARDCADQTRRVAELLRELADEGASNLSDATSQVAQRSRQGEDEHRRAAA